MIYPAFLKKGDLIGITAPSAGVGAEEGFDLSLSHIKAKGWRIRETENLRTTGPVSGPAVQRAAQLNALLRDGEVNMVWCAQGGDFLVDMLPFVDFEAAAAHPKWVQGYSDPTSLLYALTTTRDIATIYSFNAGGFDGEILSPAMEYSLSLLEGAVPPQHSFERYARWGEEEDHPVFWETPHGPVKVTGRLIGGCMDCLLDILGTPFDGTRSFIERYKAEGILWYFDVFALKAEQVYNALWHMKTCGWFEGAVGAVFGRICFPHSELGLTYRDMITAALPELPLVLEADVGHVSPRMTVINGALATLTAERGRGTLSMELI